MLYISSRNFTKNSSIRNLLQSINIPFLSRISNHADRDTKKQIASPQPDSMTVVKKRNVKWYEHVIPMPSCKWFHWKQKEKNKRHRRKWFDNETEPNRNYVTDNRNNLRCIEGSEKRPKAHTACGRDDEEDGECHQGSGSLKKYAHIW